jgi:hypothetical protein
MVRSNLSCHFCSLYASKRQFADGRVVVNDHAAAEILGITVGALKQRQRRGWARLSGGRLAPAVAAETEGNADWFLESDVLALAEASYAPIYEALFGGKPQPERA